MTIAIATSAISFSIGAVASLLARHFLTKNFAKHHAISRLYPTLSIARDVYNQVAHKLDLDCADFKMLKLDIKHNKRLQAFEVICIYKSLNGKKFTF